ncbi:signal-regulatory protein beta-2-like [Indicator indicator]|uniref:signal-regulatory protein beta-2-like n=1 Tax=Indicator indicator TaxID=1002788 RepID=UPI0023DF9F04|nr:signal-regulatory protein beta-2-like [Indicator indicator]
MCGSTEHRRCNVKRLRGSAEGLGAQKKWSLRLQQPQEQLWVTVGQMLTLTCSISGEGPPGPVEWLKGWGSENKTIYAQTSSSPRVTRVVNGSNVDFSIQIRDVQPEDAGTYYCVKFTRTVGLGAGLQVFQHGKGTVVSVHDTALAPGMVAAAVVLFLLLLLGLLVTLCMYRRKHRGQADSQSLSRACCAETPSTTRLQQSSKEDTTIHYADLQPLPTAPWCGRSPGTTCSEYASVRIAAK